MCVNCGGGHPPEDTIEYYRRLVSLAFSWFAFACLPRLRSQRVDHQMEVFRIGILHRMELKKGEGGLWVVVVFVRVKRGRGRRWRTEKNNVNLCTFVELVKRGRSIY